MKSLAKTLREQQGVPGFREMSEVIASGLGSPLDEPFAALDRIVRDHHSHRHTKVAAEAAKFILVSQGSLTGSGAASDIAEQFRRPNVRVDHQAQVLRERSAVSGHRRKVAGPRGSLRLAAPARTTQSARAGEDCRPAAGEPERRTSASAKAERAGGVHQHAPPPGPAPGRSATARAGDAAAVNTELYTYDFTVHPGTQAFAALVG